MYTVYYAEQKVASFEKLGEALEYVSDEEAYWPLWEEVLNETKEFRMGWRHGRWFIRG